MNKNSMASTWLSNMGWYSHICPALTAAGHDSSEITDMVIWAQIQWTPLWYLRGISWCSGLSFMRAWYGITAHYRTQMFMLGFQRAYSKAINQAQY